MCRRCRFVIIFIILAFLGGGVGWVACDRTVTLDNYNRFMMEIVLDITLILSTHTHTHSQRE
jgi:hypothetical protein